MGVFLGGSCPGGNFPGGSFLGWEFSWVGVVQVGIFGVGVFLSGSCPGGNFLWWNFSRWELSGGKHAGGNFLGGSFHVTDSVIVTNIHVSKVRFTVVPEILYVTSFRKFFFKICFVKFII